MEFKIFKKHAFELIIQLQEPLNKLLTSVLCHKTMNNKFTILQSKKHTLIDNLNNFLNFQMYFKLTLGEVRKHTFPDFTVRPLPGNSLSFYTILLATFQSQYFVIVIFLQN